MSQEVHLMRLVKEAEKMGILAMRLGSENIPDPVQPVHPARKGTPAQFGDCEGGRLGA